MTRRRLPRRFYTRDARELAPLLLNKVLVTGVGAARVAARIVEVEAYAGHEDPGSHAYRGLTPRNRTMFGPPGHLYVYFTYGMHWCANVVAGTDGVATAVLLRGAAPLEGAERMRSRRPAARRDRDLCSGPARLTQAFGITGRDDGADLVRGPLRIVDDGVPPPARPGQSTRIGLRTGRGDEHRWRWFVPNDANVSRNATRADPRSTRTHRPPPSPRVAVPPRRVRYGTHHPKQPLARFAGVDVDPNEQLRILSGGTVDVITEADLRRKLARRTPLRVKLGIDPTASDIHLGFAVVLRKLRQFQELGHIAVLIVGDFTAQVGDPSGRSATRPTLTHDEVEEHGRSYVDQIRRILLPDRLEVRRNSEWLSKMGIDEVLQLAARATVAQLLERDDFTKRYQAGRPISLKEFFYPLLQGWDSVMVHADVELGGTDQLFNNLMGRTLQDQEGQEPQVVLTLPLLEGLHGDQKMSKSLGNYVGVAEPPTEQFGKLMSLTDRLMPQYFALTTGWDPQQVTEVTHALETGELAPVDAKRRLARTVVDLYHGHGAGEAAEAEFDRVFRAHEAPAEVPEHVLDRAELGDGPVRLAAVLRQAGLVASNREGSRQIAGRGVKRNGEIVEDPDLTVTAEELDGDLLSVGRRKWARIRVP